MCAHESLLEISREPNPFLHFFTAKQVFSFFDQLVSAHLNVLVKQIATQNLLSVLVIELVAHYEQKTEGGLGNKLHVLVVEE